MPSRRDFLIAAGGLGVAARGLPRALAAEKKTIASPANAPIGVQLWTFRESLPRDLAGTLGRIRALGFERVEGAGLWKHTAAELRKALDAARLACVSTHAGFERLRDDLPGALAEAKAVGAGAIVCPWIPHEKAFTREDALKSAEAFNRFGKAARDAGLGFGYHCHGYEFVPAPEGTLFDTLAQNSDKELVGFQVDVFHAYRGGADPVRLIETHGRRVTSLHLKDIKKGTPQQAGNPDTSPELDVPVGTGQIDWPAVLRAAVKAGTSHYFVEDESADPWGHVPNSVAYLETLKL
jgi:sugar phosphate isomerase/epimerase